VLADYANNQVGEVGVNCTTGALLPDGPVPLLYNLDDLTNVSISVPTPSSGVWTNIGTSSLDAFVNGTAVGLICFTPPDRSANAWPYGGGGVNAAVGGATTTTSSGGGSMTSAAVSGSASSKQAAGAGGSAIVDMKVLVTAGLVLSGVVVGAVII
jgi:hypothetical protein